jgi:hypothetical protein
MRGNIVERRPVICRPVQSNWARTRPMTIWDLARRCFRMACRITVAEDQRCWGNTHRDVGKGRTLADRTVVRPTHGQDRNLLAGVIHSAPGRIASVVSRDDREVVFADDLFELRYP